MKKVTYLFGAGASRHTIPIVDQLIPSMAHELKILKNDFDNLLDAILKINENPYVNKSVFTEFITDFERVVSDGEKHQSIDTYAKKLFIQGELADLKRLKTILSFFFIIIQSRGKADLRYDSFFASILQESPIDFPKNLKILSWNYDYQFEKSYAEYSRDNRTEACFSSLNIISKNSRISSQIDNSRFGILKLNGTASFMLDTDSSRIYNFIQDVNAEYNIPLIHSILQNYASLHHIQKTKTKLIPSLSFAWEDYAYGKYIVNKAIEFTNQTEILIVIGYSFPFFNRLVDRDIINSMKNLEKVYFQAPDADDLKERFLAIRDNIPDNNLVIRKDVKQFVFANEF